MNSRANQIITENNELSIKICIEKIQQLQANIFSTSLPKPQR